MVASNEPRWGGFRGRPGDSQGRGRCWCSSQIMGWTGNCGKRVKDIMASWQPWQLHSQLRIVQMLYRTAQNDGSYGCESHAATTNQIPRKIQTDRKQGKRIHMKESHRLCLFDTRNWSCSLHKLLRNRPRTESDRRPVHIDRIPIRRSTPRPSPGFRRTLEEEHKIYNLY